ncbi:hypothetical protein EON65_20700 [archaeon]|nr:MAG: hypothetical protein EON65_20700 [archaeon]
MIDLEDHVIEIQEGKHNVRVKSNVDGLRRVLRLIDSQISYEANKHYDDFLLRAKRQAQEERTTQILDQLYQQRECILFAMEDGMQRLVQFHLIKNNAYAATNKFIKQREVSLVSQKQKWLLRVPDFSRLVIDDLQVSDEQVDKNKISENKVMNFFQQSMKAVLSLSLLDVVQLNESISFLNSFQYKSLLCLYYGTQLLAMICEAELEFLQGKVGPSNWSSILPLSNLLPAVFDFIRSSEAIADMAFVLLPPTLQATKAMLTLYSAARYCQYISMQPPGQQQVTAKRKSKDEGAILRGVRDAWEAQRCRLVHNILDCLSLLLKAGTQAPSLDYTLSDKPAKGHVTLGTLRSVFHDQHTVIANLLLTCKMIYLDPFMRSPEQEEMSGKLMHKALQLGRYTITQYAIRLGHTGNITPLVICDPLYFTVHDNNAIAALECAAASFSTFVYDDEALNILLEASHLLPHRYMSFFLSSAYLKGYIAACLYYVERGNEVRPHSPNTMRSSSQRDPLSATIAHASNKILAILAAHKNSLTVCHKGMLLLRLLMTDAFLKRTVIEEYCSLPLLALLDPWLGAEKPYDEEEEEELANDADDMGTINNSVVTQESNTTATSSVALSIMSIMSVPSYMRKFKQDLLHKAFHNIDQASYGYATPSAAPTSSSVALEITLADILKYVCENHSQSSEVLEQVLLLIEHLASKSQLCKYLIVETGLPRLLQRTFEAKPAELYIATLVDICLEALEI